LGWALGENWRQVEDYVGWLQYLAIAAVAFFILRYVGKCRGRMIGNG
jgi:membrane protein DedA with SNARE-associated domain